MAESKLPGGAPPKDETGLLEILKLLIETKKVRSTSDLLKYAGQYGAPEAEERLRVMEAEGIPLDLAFDAVSVHLRILAHKRSGELLTGCRGKKAGLILPLPPHVPELFGPVAAVTYLLPEPEIVHGGLHEFSERAVKGSRECRAKAQQMEVLVFEAYRENGELFVDVAVAEVIEPRMLPAGVALIAHLRPHRNPRDVAYQTTTPVSFI
ncbi:MAG TPA: hypothetical protein VK961_22330 [Chthoniobacter sp.]|nr:hypothetical protein [Chthoniobacter sp.]